MVNAKINGIEIQVEKGTTILDAAREKGIRIPTLCYLKEINEIGACRMCVVEDDRGKIFASCSEVPRDGMVIYTHTPRLQHHRKMILPRCSLQDVPTWN